MPRSAFLDPAPTGWTLTVDGSSSNHGEFEEALRQARELLGGKGGGTIYVSAGENVEAGAIRVPARPARPDPPPSPPGIVPDAPPPAPVVEPNPLFAARPSMRTSKGPAPAEGKPAPADARTDVAALARSYQAARSKIEALPNAIERDIGMGTLRLEASEMLGRLQGSSLGLSPDDLAPLTEQVAALNGGKVSENAVRAFDKATEKVMKDVGASLVATKLTGSVAFLVGLLSAMADLLLQAGAGLAKGVAAGTISAGVIARVLSHAPEAGERTYLATTGWAQSLGAQGEQALSEPRRIQEDLLAAIPETAALPPPGSLASRARARAEFIVYASWTGVVLGLLGLVLGFVSFFD